MQTWMIALVLIALALVLGGFVARSYLSGTSLKETVFRPRPERRLSVVEQTSLDGRRKLVLIKRDGVEHLVMTGGPVDIVIETGIGATRQRTLPVTPSGDTEPAAAPVFSRAPRALGQAVNE